MESPEEKNNSLGLVYQRERRSIAEAGVRLSRFIDLNQVLDRIEGPRHPLIIFAFDEFHILTDAPRGQSWSVFSELCSVLHELHYQPIFSLFLSTSGQFHRFSQSDPSPHLTHLDTSPLHPITEISFDDLAYPAEEHHVKLSDVTEIKWISHLGRPLCVHFHS
jgi:hypothetical protein